MTSTGSVTPLEVEFAKRGMELPGGWRVAQLDELFEVQQGKSLSQKARAGKSPRPFLRTANVLWGRVDLNKIDQMDFTEEEAKRLSLKPGDLLTCEGGEVGRTALWQGEMEGVSYQNHLHRLRRRNEEVDPAFYMYWMQAALLHFGLYAGAANRTTIPNLSKSRLSSFVVPVPPYAEQKAIATALHTVQQAKEATEKIINASRELKRSLSRQIFTYGPVPISETEGVRLQDTEIGQMPSHWQVPSLGDITRTSLKNGIFVKNPKWDTGVRYLNVADVYPNAVLNVAGLRLMEVPEAAVGSFSVTEGDLVFVRSSLKREGVAMACLVPESSEAVVFDCHLIRIAPELSVVDPRYLVEYCRSDAGHPRLVSLSKTTTMTTIPQLNLSKFNFALPPLPEQREISSIFEILDHKIRTERARTSVLESVFVALLCDLMAGKRRATLPEAAHA